MFVFWWFSYFYCESDFGDCFWYGYLKCGNINLYINGGNFLCYGFFLLYFFLWSVYYCDECEWWKVVYWVNYFSDWYNIKNVFGCS